MTDKLDLTQHDMTTREGIDAAKRQIGEFRRDNAIREFHAAIETDKDTEALEDQIQEINLLNEFLTEQPAPKITEWDEIEITEREWLIKNWIPANTVTMFTGEGGAGKSWLTLQAVCQIACGFRNAFLDPNFTKTADIESRRSVVFATYEDEPAEIKRRLFALASGMPWIEESMAIIQQHVRIVDMRGIGSIWGPGLGRHIANTGDLLMAGEDLRALCEDQDARLLVMDPLSGAFGSSENDRTAVYDFVSSFRGWGDYAKCAMLLIGHLPKAVESRAAGYSGSTAWEASARSMWTLTKKSFKEDSVADAENRDQETASGGKRKRKLQVQGTKRFYWALQHIKSNYAKIQGSKPLIKSPYGWWREAATIEEAAAGYDMYEASFDESEVTDDDTREIIPEF